MTCQDARPLLSALIDEALPERDRAACAEHVAECADCARELARLRITVDLVRGIGPVRAPAGFVDRVVAAARAETRRSRARHDVGRGWRFNVPLSAAAAVLVAVIGVSLYRLTPELRDATRHDVPPPREAPATRQELPGPPSIVTAPEPGPSEIAAVSKAETSRLQRAAPPVASAPPATPATPATPAPPAIPATPAPPAQSPTPAVAAVPPRMDAPRTPTSAPARTSERPAEREARAADAAAPPREVAAKAAARPEPPAGASAPTPPPAPSADRNVFGQMERSVDSAAGLPVEATLTVTALPGIEGAVADVASRHRASLRGRAQEADGVRLTLNVPADAYVELTRALQGIGRFSGPTQPPHGTGPIELILHIGL